MGMKPPDTPLAPSAIELHIEELVLHGFPAGDRFRIGDAVERELLRLIGERGLGALIARPASTRHVDAGSFKIAPGAKPQAIGAQLAQNLHQQLSPLPSATSPKTRAKATGTKETRMTR